MKEYQIVGRKITLSVVNSSRSTIYRITRTASGETLYHYEWQNGRGYWNHNTVYAHDSGRSWWWV